MESGPDLTGALSPDRELARHAAFALYTLLWLEATGPYRGGSAPPISAAGPPALTYPDRKSWPRRCAK